MSRLEKLKELLQKDTHNAFALYGLAMEHRSRGELEQAADYFRTLLENHPDYTPAFLHFGLTLHESGNAEEAILILETGVDVCTRKGEDHAREELLDVLRQIRDSG